MTPEFVVTFGGEAVKMALMLSAPLLGVGLAVGLFIAILQATTQVQEMTLTFVPKIVKTLNRLPASRKSRIAKVELSNEKEIIEDAVAFLKSRFNSEVFVFSEEDESRYDPKQRATIAMPYHPAIFVE